MSRSLRSVLPAVFLSLAVQGTSFAQNDSVYGARIREYTTDTRFLSPLVDHLPLSESVPSPLEHFGTIIGAPDILHNTSEIYGYMRALAAASPRVTVRTIGRTEEGREMIEVIIADEATLSSLDDYRGVLNRLSDPRNVSEAEARELIERSKPIYYFTAGLHSPETGPPEMVMELAYRLAVEDSPMIQAIRRNVITIIVPATEADGRDRMVDVYRYRKDHNDQGPGLIYWGKYVAHDNNRDGFGLSLALTRNILKEYLYWKPTVMHDLHESGFYLYTSTGSGPYNEYIDPLTIDEWHNLAHEEVTALTRIGMPGVWTHAFYTGWAANYLMWMANTRNSLGRFYETLGNGGADTRLRELPKRATSREWYRPNPPLEKTMWSLRNNTNYMETGVLVALEYVADNAHEFVESFYLRSQRAVEKGRNSPPYAWVIPSDQERREGVANLVNLLLDQAIEVQTVEEDLKYGEDEAPKGSYLVRMDQPYRNLIQILLDKQDFPKDAVPPYDDTGWTLPYLHNVKAFKVKEEDVLARKMSPVTAHVKLDGEVDGNRKKFYLVDNTTDDNFTVFRFELEGVKVLAAERGFEADKHDYAAGSFVIPRDGNPEDLDVRLERAATATGVIVRGTNKDPGVPVHEVEVPRIALVHTWVATPQDAGWWRFAFDHIGIPYTYLSEQDLAATDLDQFDVIIMPRTRANPQTLVQGRSMLGDPIPWKKSARYPSLGVIDETDDVRRGMGYEGVENLKSFIERGGVFITEGQTAAFPIDMGITRRVSIRRTRSLLARGSVLSTHISDSTSPISYGYGTDLPAYFSQSPVFSVDTSDGGSASPDWLRDRIWRQEMPRVILRFAKKDLLLSGMLKGEKEIARRPAVIDVPVGDGHVVLFAIRPFWRWETRGSHALVFNTLLNWNDLRTGWPERPGPQDADVATENQ